MKPEKPVVYLVSRNKKSLQVIEKSIEDHPIIVASSAKCLQRASKDQGIKVILLDRSMHANELKEFLSLGDDYPLATFGIVKSSSDVLNSIESKAAYQLRHPAASRDIGRLFDHLKDLADAGTPLPASRSSHLYRGLVGDSAAIRQLRELIQKIAPSKSTVLLTGETGTGKEITARNIHYLSGQGAGAFVPVNCSAIPADLLESELFGHKKGAFTGALSDREGRFAMASGGTLFLDEIGDMTPALQVKLLRVLEERIIYRVGCNKPIPMTGRLVAATHRDLEECVQRGTFREDLYYRLSVVPVEVPALRDRKEDIAQLARELSCRLQRCQGIGVDLTPSAIACLQAYDWPGNVRELSNLVERLAVIDPNGTADVADLPDKYRGTNESPSDRVFAGHSALNVGMQHQILPEDGIDLKGYLKSTEAALILQALNYCGGTVSRAAMLLHVGRTTLTEKVKRLGLLDHINTSRETL